MDELLRFVKEVRPKSVLTFHGASDLFSRMLSKRLGIQARQLTTEPLRKKTQVIKLDETRILTLEDRLMSFIQTPGFTYEKRDLMNLGLKEGFKSTEVEEALLRLTRNGVLKYSSTTDGYSIP